MKHFIGGYAFGFLFMLLWSMERTRLNGGQGIGVGIAFGWIFGLAAWGLL